MIKVQHSRNFCPRSTGRLYHSCREYGGRYLFFTHIGNCHSISSKYTVSNPKTSHPSTINPTTTHKRPLQPSSRRPPDHRFQSTSVDSWMILLTNNIVPIGFQTLGYLHIPAIQLTRYHSIYGGSANRYLVQHVYYTSTSTELNTPPLPPPTQRETIHTETETYFSPCTMALILLSRRALRSIVIESVNADLSFLLTFRRETHLRPGFSL